MRTFWIIFICGWLVMMIGIAIANFAIFTMMEQVNARLAPSNQISLLSWYGNKIFRVWKLHEGFELDRQLRRRIIAGLIVGVIGLLGAGTELMLRGTAAPR